VGDVIGVFAGISSMVQVRLKLVGENEVRVVVRTEMMVVNEHHPTVDLKRKAVRHPKKHSCDSIT
jgi:hypothetical protein